MTGADFTVLKAQFLVQTACRIANPVPNPCADFDGNGVASAADFTLLKQNFLLSGPLPTA